MTAAVVDAAGSGVAGVHPYADKFPMLPADELSHLAESIRANGLRQPVVVTLDGLVLDGRNRAAACAQVGIEPETVVYEGEDLAEYVIDANVTRRNMSTGARAMASALVYEAAGQRENGRWKRDSVQGANGDSSTSGWIKALRNAGVVMDYAYELAEQVVAGDVALDAAYQQAKTVKDGAEHEKVRAREQATRERDQVKADAERDAKIVADLTQAKSKYVALIEDGTLTPEEAWAGHREQTRKERLHEEELDQGRRDTCRRIAQCAFFLEGGQAYARSFLDEFYPHEGRFLHDDMQLSRARIDSAIEFLTTVRDGVTR